MFFAFYNFEFCFLGFDGSVRQSIKSTTWGNMYLVDSEGNSLWLYGFYDQQGNRFDAMSTTPAVGDEITIYGQITKYLNSSGGIVIEVINAVWIP